LAISRERRTLSREEYQWQEKLGAKIGIELLQSIGALGELRHKLLADETEIY
jgi:hypothetical protein